MEKNVEFKRSGCSLNHVPLQYGERPPLQEANNSYGSLLPDANGGFPTR